VMHRTFHREFTKACTPPGFPKPPEVEKEEPAPAPAVTIVIKKNDTTPDVVKKDETFEAQTAALVEGAEQDAQNAKDAESNAEELLESIKEDEQIAKAVEAAMNGTGVTSVTKSAAIGEEEDVQEADKAAATDKKEEVAETAKEGYEKLINEVQDEVNAQLKKNADDKKAAAGTKVDGEEAAAAEKKPADIPAPKEDVVTAQYASSSETEVDKANAEVEEQIRMVVQAQQYTFKADKVEEKEDSSSSSAAATKDAAGEAEASPQEGKADKEAAGEETAPVSQEGLSAYMGKVQAATAAKGARTIGQQCSSHDGCSAGEFCFKTICDKCSECRFDHDAVDGACPQSRCPGTPTLGAGII